jgi:hypothetical protein
MKLIWLSDWNIQTDFIIIVYQNELTVIYKLTQSLQYSQKIRNIMTDIRVK